MPPAKATAYLKQLIDFERRHADVLWHGRFVDNQGFDFKGDGLMAKGYAAGDKLGVVVWNPSDKPATFSLAVPQARLVSATEPERDPVGPSGPLAPQSIRLLLWQKKVK